MRGCFLVYMREGGSSVCARTCCDIVCEGGHVAAASFRVSAHAQCVRVCVLDRQEGSSEMSQAECVSCQL